MSCVVEQARVLSNVPVAKDVWKMELNCSIGSLCRPGQFVMIGLEGFFLRRPISVSDSTDTTLTLVYKVVGKGTLAMSRLAEGDFLSVEGPLGQGFPVEKEAHVLLVGGGVGVPPLLKTAKALQDQGTVVDVVLGFGSKADIFYTDEFMQLGITPVIATMDGSAGIKGTVLDAISQADLDASFVMACGPIPMLKALSSIDAKGYVSLESRMGCGTGVCMGCVMKDQDGQSVRVCKDGPVFPIGKVVL